jgi:hypothetical protein
MKEVICLISVAFMHNPFTPSYKYALKLLNRLIQFLDDIVYGSPSKLPQYIA